MEELWLDAKVQFCKVLWSELKEGDLVYTHDEKYRDNKAYGPFTVLDPSSGRIKNRSEAEFTLPNVQMLRIVN